jgi:LCP family protein required for cell wall assembly
VHRTAGQRHSPQARHVARTRPVRRVLTSLLTIFAVLLITGTAAAGYALYRLNGNIDVQDVSDAIGPDEDRPDKVAEAHEDTEALNILVMGSDKREQDESFGERSDTTILLHLAADRNSAVGVSIPRDTMVDIPECQRPDGSMSPAISAHMFNEAFSIGGPACTIKTVESMTDVRIDQYVVLDFRGFKDMVNALGGVEVCVPYDVQDAQSHLDLEAGRQTVQGDQALAYVRTRKALGNGGDLSRLDRQQAFLSSMVTKVKGTGLLTRPDRLFRFLDAATKSLTTDIGGLNSLRKLAQQVRGINTGSVEFLTAPNEPYPADPNRVQLAPAAEGVWDAIRFDQPLPGRGKSQPTATPTGPPLKTPPERVYVRVLNGTGIGGEAARVANELEAAGFNVVEVGNADRTDYTTTEVRHDPGYDESGRTLGASIDGATVVSDAALSTTLEVIVGADNPTAKVVEVPTSTTSPDAGEPLKVRKATDNICNTE